MEANQVNYNTLQSSIDKVVGKIGLARTIRLLTSFISNSAIPSTESEKLNLLTTYIVAQTIVIFDLKEDQFYESAIPEYREARMACYYMLKKYTGCSHAWIGDRFGLTKRNVLYYTQKCDEMLTIPQYYKSFCIKLEQLDNRTVEFLSKF